MNSIFKVENGSLKGELQEKQELLCQAAKALELMEETEKKAHLQHQTLADEHRTRIKTLEVSVYTFVLLPMQLDTIRSYFIKIAGKNKVPRTRNTYSAETSSRKTRRCIGLFI